MLLQVKAVCRLVGGLVFLLWLTGCAGTPQTDSLTLQVPAALVTPTELSHTPFFPQEDYQCGPAALAMLMQAQGLAVTPDELKDEVYLPERKGSLQIEMLTATRRHGLLPYVLRPELEELLYEVQSGRPVLVLQNQGVSWYPQWHYAVVIGYNLQEGQLILRSGTIERYVMSIYTFERTWQRSQYWAMLALRPGELPVRPDEWHYLQAVVGFEQTKAWPLIDMLYRTGLHQWPTSKDLLMGYGNALYAQHELQAASAQYRSVLQEFPDYAPAHNNLAMVLAEQGEFSRALHHVQRAIDLGGVHSAEYQSTLSEIRQLQATSKKP